MALAHRTNYWQNQQSAPRHEDWNALRNELETLLEQVELQQQGINPTPRSAPAKSSPALSHTKDLRPPAPPFPHERRQSLDRRQQALSSVQQAIERFNEPEEALLMPPHSQKQLQTAIDQIRASQNQPGGRNQTRSGPGARARPHPDAARGNNRINSNQIEGVVAALGDISRRFEQFESAFGAQQNSVQALKDMASQVEQLSCVVELLANSVGERSQMKRLEAQIAKLADVVGNGSELDFQSIDQRLGVLSGAFERLSQLQSEQWQKLENADDLKHMENTHLQDIQTGVRNIYERLDGMDMAAVEASVRSIYDRIDALEANMATPVPAIERLSRELADFSKALRDEKGPVVSSSLVSRVDALNQRISQIEDSGQPVEALKIDMQELHGALVGAMEPRFAALEDKIGALSGQFADKGGSGLPDISAGDLEKQIRLLADKMDETSSELDGLQRLYTDQGVTELNTDISAIAELVAQRTSEAVQKVQEGQSDAINPDAMAQLETRLSALFAKSKTSADQQGFSRVQDSIEQVNKRLERLEISLRDAEFVSGGPDTHIPDAPLAQNSLNPPAPGQAPSAPGSTVADAAPLSENETHGEHSSSSRLIPEPDDKMPKAPSDEAPLNAPAYPAPIPENDRVPVPQSLCMDPEIAENSAISDLEFDQTAPARIETGKKSASGTGRIKLPQFDRENVAPPPAPISSLETRDDNASVIKPRNADGEQGASEPVVAAKDGAQEASHEKVSRSTFIQAARRAAQKHNPQPQDRGSQSLIGLALARFQKRQASNKPDQAPKAAKAAKPYSQTKRWRQKPPQDKPVQNALSKKEHLAERAIDDFADEGAGVEKSATAGTDEFGINDLGVKDVSSTNGFLNKHRQSLLLAAALLAVSLLTLNLINQRAGETLSAANAIITTGSDAAASNPNPASGANPEPSSPAPLVEQPQIKTGDITGSIKGFSAQSGSSVRVIDPTKIAEMPPRLDLASLNSEEITAPPVTLELPPEAIGPLALRKAAAGGDVRAQFEVGAIYAEGRAITQDLGAAARWYQRAAAQGFAPAAYRLGNMYENGVGVDKDLKQARLWYRRGADAGNRMSMHNLASLLASGNLGEQKFSEAAQWFEKAAALGLKDSQFNLGMLYARGLGVPQDMESSFKWFSIAAAQGDQDAAKRAQDIARSLDPATLSRLQAELKNWAPMNMNVTANFAPIGTWSDSFDPGPAIEKRDVILQVQAVLNRIGFDTGVPDGLIGPKTTKAIKAFERAIGMSESGTVNPRLLAVLGSQPV